MDLLPTYSVNWSIGNDFSKNWCNFVFTKALHNLHVFLGAPPWLNFDPAKPRLIERHLSRFCLYIATKSRYSGAPALNVQCQQFFVSCATFATCLSAHIIAYKKQNSSVHLFLPSNKVCENRINNEILSKGGIFIYNFLYCTKFFRNRQKYFYQWMLT
jgi:hypothetical protein